MSELLKRLTPYAALFMLLQTLLRLGLMAWEWSNVDHTFTAVAGTLALGVFYDVAVLLYMMVFPALYWLFLPRGRKGSRGDKIAATMIFAIMAYGWCFGLVAEWIFWGEFSTRFNFIAVNYLVYTTEVLGDIWESYPVIPIFAAIAVATAALTALARPWRYARAGDNGGYATEPAGKRFAVFALFVLVILGSYKGVKDSYADVFDNAYSAQIARNGVFSLWHAFWDNKLDYDRFYVTEKEGPALLRQELATPEAAFLDKADQADILRHIQAAHPAISPNVIFVTMESMSADYMRSFGSKGHLTPYMDSLAGKSLFFTNLYANGTRTVRGLEALTLSTAPSPGDSIVRQPDNGGLFTLGSVFRRHGYDTAFVYGGYGYFDNMNAFFSANGYRILDRHAFPAEDIDFANVWGVDDVSLYREVIKDADRNYAKGRKFFQMVMTTSNHRPYTFPPGRIDIPSHSGRAGGVKYADYAVGWLLKEAAKKPWFDNTVFVFVADHCASSAGREVLTVSKHHIPAIIYAPRLIAPRKVDQLVSQIDLPPTLLGILGWSYDSRFAGKDALHDHIGRAFIADYQNLGYLTEDGRMTVLQPRKHVKQFVKEKRLPDSDIDETHVSAAVSYYQHAAKWQQNLQDVPGGAAKVAKVAKKL
jgi:phosphoglycerol transferase MdoB-like AlkP superfamily enzyme